MESKKTKMFDIIFNLSIPLLTKKNTHFVNNGKLNEKLLENNTSFVAIIYCNYKAITELNSVPRKCFFGNKRIRFFFSIYLIKISL